MYQYYLMKDPSVLVSIQPCAPPEKIMSQWFQATACTRRSVAFNLCLHVHVHLSHLTPHHFREACGIFVIRLATLTYLGTRSPSRFLLTNTFSNSCSIHVPNLSVHSNNESLALLHFINRSAVLRLHSVPQISPTRLLYQSQLVSATSAPLIMVSLRRSARVSVKSESKGERANDNHTAEVATEPVKRGRKRKATQDQVGSVSTHHTSRQHC